MRIFLTDQPFRGGPGTTGPLSRHALKVAWIAYILRSKRGELFVGTQLNMVVVSFSGGAGFFFVSEPPTVFSWYLFSQPDAVFVACLLPPFLN